MAPYAFVEVALILLFGVGGSLVLGVVGGWWAILTAVPTLFLLWFYRDPPRRIPNEAGLVVAPADGRIVTIERDLPSVTGDGARELRIMIFLSVFNVHVNRAPCAGTVATIEYSPGRFLNALRPESDTENENNVVVLTPTEALPGPFRVRQIAGLLARRIVCRLAVGQQVARGERFGMIKLGSRTELRVPDDPRWQVVARTGQRVRGGSTVLLRWQGDGT